VSLATLDIVIIAVVLLSALIGLVRGLIKEVLSLASWVIAFVVAIFFSEALGELLPPSWGSGALRQAIAFVLLFVGSLVFAGILQWLIHQLIESTGLSGTDRFLGFLFGGVRGLLVALVGLIGLEQIAFDAVWWREARLPGEILAFEDEARALFGHAQSYIREDVLPRSAET
jgi:membrane protein required for colicin V production